MFLKEDERSKVNSSKLSSYESLLKKEELIEEQLVRDFDNNIKKMLGNTLYNYLKERNLITTSFLVNFHYTDIPIDEVFAYEDGKEVSVRDYYRMQVSKFFKQHTKNLRKVIEGKDLSERLLDEYTPYAFALSSLGLTVFHPKKNMHIRDVQKLAGFGMCYGEIAELATGEGKTIAAVLPAYFHALRGKGVHVITANSYLSRRDFTELSPVYRGLGLTCGYVESEEDIKDDRALKESKKNAYRCDITYSPKDEIAFDYLRDSTAKKIEDVVTRYDKSGFAIIDEVDDALVDGANSPYVIAGLPSVYKENMTIEDLVDAMSLPIDMVTSELSLRGINVSNGRTFNKDEATKIAELFSKNIYDDLHDSLEIAQAYYTYARMNTIRIKDSDRPIFKKFENLIEMENGIMRINDIRLYNLLIGDEQDLQAYSYYGKYALDPNDIHTLRKYTKIVVCPTSRSFYVNSNAFEEYLNLQFLSDENVTRQIIKDKEKILKYLDLSCYNANEKGDVRLTLEGIRKIARSGKLASVFPELAYSYDQLINNKNELGSYFNHLLSQTIIANELLVYGEDYTISNGEIILLKNAREQVGSRYTDGLEQAVEVKEMRNGRVKQTQENPSLASITQKEFYARYDMFSGMTGTSAKRIFEDRYGKTTLEIPRDAYYRYYSKRLNREGRASKIKPRGIDKRRDVFARNNKDKYKLVLQSIKESLSSDPQGPVLLVVSDPNELYSLEQFLLSNGIDPNVIETSRLGDEYKRETEAVKVAKAGRPGMVTLATMMAGRGTDIQLGGDRDTFIDFATSKTMREGHIKESARDDIRVLCEESLLKQGLIPTKEKELQDREALSRIGLKVISVGFFDSKRLDRQLEGRTGRNGISGITERYSSPEDLLHLGLERIHGEPLLDLFNRATRFGDGSINLGKSDYDRLIGDINTLQEAKDTEISQSIKFSQDMSSVASDKLEKIRTSRRKLLELTRDDKTILANEKQIKEEVYKMFELTVDNILVSFIRNNKYVDYPEVLADGIHKDLLQIDYQGLKYACKEILGIDVNVNSFANSDASILEFRDALIKYTKDLHETMLRSNKAFILKRDVKALLHKDDDNISRIHQELEDNKRQKRVDYLTNKEGADSLSILSMGRKLRDLECSSAKAGTRLILGRILRKDEKQLLERHRKELFDFRIGKYGTEMPCSREDDSVSIGLFEKSYDKKKKESIEEKKEVDEHLAKTIDFGACLDYVLPPVHYRHLSIRPMCFELGKEDKFVLRKTGPVVVDLLNSKKTI